MFKYTNANVAFGTDESVLFIEVSFNSGYRGVPIHVLFLTHREFFHLLSKGLVNPHYALFKSINGLYKPNAQSSVNPTHLQYFNLCGKMMARMICDSMYYTQQYHTLNCVDF